MAYNVLKGNVEGSVDQHADQHIDGVKVFKNTVSASVFYDTDAGAPCVTTKDVAIATLEGSAKNGIITLEGDRTAKVHHNLSFDGATLGAPQVCAQVFQGSGEKLTNLPANQFIGEIKADSIAHGSGLKSVRGTLQANPGEGLTVENSGLTLNLAPHGGLKISSKKLTIDPATAHPINTSGQNLSDTDVLLVSDVSRGTTNSTTLGNLCDSYLMSKIPTAAGTLNAIQLKGKRGFASSAKLSYDTSSETLNVQGKLAAANLNVGSKLTCGGAVIKNITTVRTKTYEVSDFDYTLICDTVNSPITVTIPPACNHTGRLLVIKKSNTDKYNLRSYPVRVRTLEGTIDLNDELIIKTNYSARTLQSDGETWHVIGSKGT